MTLLGFVRCIFQEDVQEGLSCAHVLPSTPFCRAVPVSGKLQTRKPKLAVLWAHGQTAAALTGGFLVKEAASEGESRHCVVHRAKLTLENVP